MAWRTVRLICGAPNAYCFPKLVWVLWLAANLAPGQSPAPAGLADCRPCSFSPGGKFASFDFTFDLETQGAHRTVRAIDVYQDSQKIQRLPVPDMDPIGLHEQFFFGGVDVDFDGLLDLMLITRRGVANTYAAYWRFNPRQGAFQAVGTFPVFRLDARRQRLSNYERGGSAGLIHQSREYAFVNGRLTLMREEKQDATSQAGAFRKVVRERVNGVLKIVRSETVIEVRQK